MTRYRYFLLSSVLQFPYSFNVQQYKFFFAPPSPRLCPHFAPYIENPAIAHVQHHYSYVPSTNLCTRLNTARIACSKLFFTKTCVSFQMNPYRKVYRTRADRIMSISRRIQQNCMAASFADVGVTVDIADQNIDAVFLIASCLCTVTHGRLLILAKYGCKWRYSKTYDLIIKLLLFLYCHAEQDEYRYSLFMLNSHCARQICLG